jgi:putative toxin-antitoxin system antitoxin component (TIGR02293 family)
LLDGDIVLAVNWMHIPQKALNSRTPIECMQTESGAQEIEDFIGHLEHGVFS